MRRRVHCLAYRVGLAARDWVCVSRREDLTVAMPQQSLRLEGYFVFILWMLAEKMPKHADLPLVRFVYRSLVNR